MQPYAIRKNRTYSLPAKFFFATLFTTVTVYITKHYIVPYAKEQKSQKGKAFEKEYFEKLDQMNREKAFSASK